MMKILHTADLHLSEEAPGRWETLEELVNLAREEEVSTLVIAGDLFDRESAAEAMRPRLREVLGGGGFQTVILPGNHDFKVYSSGFYFGDNVYVIRDWRVPVRLGGAVFWGLPHEDISLGRLAGRLREMSFLMDPEQENFLLFHGELLDTFFSRQDLGEEGEQRYMPARLSFFEPLPAGYILAGHFHSRFAAWQAPGGILFIYPGSPVAVTRRETGRRKVNLVAPGEAPREVTLNSFHYEELTITLDPFTDQDPLAELDRILSDLHPSAGVLLAVEGLFDSSAAGMSETEMATAIKKKTAPVCSGEPVLNFIDVHHILEDDLFKKFRAGLEETGHPPELKREIMEMVIRAFKGVKQCS